MRSRSWPPPSPASWHGVYRGPARHTATAAAGLRLGEPGRTSAVIEVWVAGAESANGPSCVVYQPTNRLKISEYAGMPAAASLRSFSHGYHASDLSVNSANRGGTRDIVRSNALGKTSRQRRTPTNSTSCDTHQLDVARQADRAAGPSKQDSDNAPAESTCWHCPSTAQNLPDSTRPTLTHGTWRRERSESLRA